MTKDVTPTFAVRDEIVVRLTPHELALPSEGPLSFAAELQALLLAAHSQRLDRPQTLAQAERQLTEALAVAPASISPAMDRIHRDLAEAKIALGHIDEGLHVLQRRASRPAPSAELLRALAAMLTIYEPVRSLLWDQGTALAVRYLRQAALDRSDPYHDVTLYNLIIALGPDPEAVLLLRELVQQSPRYRRAWYVKRYQGQTAWEAAQLLSPSTAPETVRKSYAESARWYSRAIRSRPRFRVMQLNPAGRVELVKIFQRSALMYANAHDAHLAADHRLRARWYAWQAMHIRRSRMRSAEKAAIRGDWQRAYAHFDWACTGVDDDLELAARTSASIALYAAGDASRGTELWDEIYRTAPVALLFRSAAADRWHQQLPTGVPGEEPISIAEVQSVLAPLFQEEHEGSL